MKIIPSGYFNKRPSTISHSYKPYDKIAPYIEMARTFSNLVYQSIYLVDYFDNRILYVSDNPIFFSGASAESIMRDGYLLYFKNVPERDLNMLASINEGVLNILDTLVAEDKLKCSLSYDFHLKQPGGDLVLINHKLIPILLDKDLDIWIALCFVSISANTNAGHVLFKNHSSGQIYELDIQNKIWKETRQSKLTKRETQILFYSIQGNTMDQIAAITNISIDTIKFHKRKLFSKLNVKSITEAAVTAMNNHLF